MEVQNEWEQMTRKMGFLLDMSDLVTYKNQYIESLLGNHQKDLGQKIIIRAIGLCRFVRGVERLYLRMRSQDIKNSRINQFI